MESSMERENTNSKMELREVESGKMESVSNGLMSNESKHINNFLCQLRMVYILLQTFSFQI